MSVIVCNPVTGCYAEVWKPSPNSRPAKTAAEREADSAAAISAVASRTTDSVSLSKALAPDEDVAPEKWLSYEERWHPGLYFDSKA